MGHYDNCRPENCSTCGQLKGHCEHTMNIGEQVKTACNALDEAGGVNDASEVDWETFTKSMDKSLADAKALLEEMKEEIRVYEDKMK